MRSNGIGINISSLSALDVFMEPGKSARVRCHVCHRMAQVKRGLMVLHYDVNAEECSGSFTHYVFDLPYAEWTARLESHMDALHKRFSGAHAIDPRVRHATRISPVRYPGKPGPIHRGPRNANQSSGHAPARLAALDAAKKITPDYPAPNDCVTA